jgi:hypothetical protein
MVWREREAYPYTVELGPINSVNILCREKRLDAD